MIKGFVSDPAIQLFNYRWFSPKLKELAELACTEAQDKLSWIKENIHSTCRNYTSPRQLGEATVKANTSAKTTYKS